MAVEFKSSMSKNELLEIAAEHGIEADDSMKKNEILKLLEQARAAEGAQEPQDGEESTTGDSNTEPPAEDAQEAAPEGYGLFVYAGPSLPHGRLKEHAVFNGTFEDVKAYLADVLEDYPQAERLIVPVERLSAQYRAQVLQRHCFDNARKQGGINDGKLFSRRFDASERHVDFYPCNR